jgi:hypothetical protein
MGKAKTKGQRRGRPRKAGPREPNGNPSRSGIDHDPIDKLAIDTRVRQMNITKEQAKDQKAGSFIGYLNLLGPRDGISDNQYEGALDYLKFRERLLRAIKSPAAIYDPDSTGAGGEVTEAYENWCKGINQEWTTLRNEIQAEQNYCRGNLWAALQLVIIEDKPIHTLVGETRLLCNILAKHFRNVTADRRAA